MKSSYDAVVVGSGPNGLAAAITLAQAGLSVILFEAKESIGGGMRSAQLTLPGFIHDICSAIHPLGIASPFLSQLPLAQHGLEWIQPNVPLAHPLDDGSAIFLERSIDRTCQNLNEDALAYKQLLSPFVAKWEDLAIDILAPLHFPSHPLLFSRFARLGVRSAHHVAMHAFNGQRARALFAGLAAHAIMPLDGSLTAAFALVLGTLGHHVGWPIPRGGSQAIANALASVFRSLGGEVILHQEIKDLDALPSSRVVLFDVTPKQLLKIAHARLSSQYKQKLEKYRYGPGVFKMDWALSQPIPWKTKECAMAGTLHLGGTLQEITSAEKAVWEGKHPEHPFVLLAQQSLFDSTRAPANGHTAWAYCHVPNGSDYDMTQRIEAQIERFAPGFRDCILARSVRSPLQLEHYNANNIGGDINGGVQDFHQFLRRPVSWLHPYSTPVKGLYLCSSSTPPGGGVHGMCGYHAARTALKECFMVLK